MSNGALRLLNPGLLLDSRGQRLNLLNLCHFFGELPLKLRAVIIYRQTDNLRDVRKNRAAGRALARRVTNRASSSLSSHCRSRTKATALWNDANKSVTDDEWPFGPVGVNCRVSTEWSRKTHVVQAEGVICPLPHLDRGIIQPGGDHGSEYRRQRKDGGIPGTPLATTGNSLHIHSKRSAHPLQLLGSLINAEGFLQIKAGIPSRNLCGRHGLFKVSNPQRQVLLQDKGNDVNLTMGCQLGWAPNYSPSDSRCHRLRKPLVELFRTRFDPGCQGQRKASIFAALVIIRFTGLVDVV